MMRQPSQSNLAKRAKRAKTSHTAVTRSELPINIVIGIVLGYLDSKDAHKASGTCYAWSRARWTCGLLIVRPMQKFTPLLSRCMPRILRELDVQCNLSKHNVEHIGTFANLQELSFRDCPQVTPTTVAMLAPLKQLKGLSFTRCSHFDHLAMANLVKQFPELQRLTFHGCVGVAKGVFEQIPKLTSLWELEVDSCPTNAEMFYHLVGMVLLKLSISDCPGFNSLFIAGTLPCLEQLTLRRHLLTNVVSLNRIGTLKELTLDHCWVMGDAGFSLLTESKVQKFTAVGCAGVEEASWLTLLPKFTELKHLDLSKNRGVNDYVIPIIPPSVEWLSLAGCTNVTGVGLNYLIANLRALDLSGLRLLQNMEFLLSLHKLEELILARCRQLNLTTFRTIAMLPEITKLSFDSCVKIEPSGLLALASKPDGSEGVPKLQQLILSDCYEVTDESVRKFMSRPRLISIDVRNCPHVTNAELSKHRHVSVVK